MRRVLLALALAALVALAGCSGGTPQEDTSQSDSVGNTSMVQVTGELPAEEGATVYRFQDEEAGVTCYVFDNYPGYSGAGGLSCVPTNETALGE